MRSNRAEPRASYRNRHGIDLALTLRPRTRAVRKSPRSGLKSWNSRRARLGAERTSSIIGKPHTAEGPARGGREEVAIGDPRVPLGRGHAAAAQHHLPGHELAVVFADRASRRAVARVGAVGARGPLPEISARLLEARDREGVARMEGLGGVAADRFGSRHVRGLYGGLPFRLGRQAAAGPAGEGLGLVEAQ